MSIQKSVFLDVMAIHISIRRSSKPIVPIPSVVSKISVLPKMSVMSIGCV